MTKFIAIKVHYDHRRSLPDYLKYSRAPTREEYDKYLSLFREEDIGGEGFHESLNFSIGGEAPARVYLPPTCIPDSKFAGEEFVIFSFTYKYDQEVPASVVGVHASARLLSTETEGIPRLDVDRIEGIEDLFYHAEAPAELTTLITPPLPYDYRAGLFTPRYKAWGNGLRYLTEENAQTILDAGLAAANRSVLEPDGTRKAALVRQAETLAAIRDRYFPRADGNGVGIPAPVAPGSLPDRELGYLGEKFAFERELEFVRKLRSAHPELSISDDAVQWISQSLPQSPFDIKTVRLHGSGIREYFLEVKSSVAKNDSNIYVSSGQTEFFSQCSNQGAFLLLSYSSREKTPAAREISLDQLKAEFELVPIKFKLAPR